FRRVIEEFCPLTKDLFDLVCDVHPSRHTSSESLLARPSPFGPMDCARLALRATTVVARQQGIWHLTALLVEPQILVNRRFGAPLHFGAFLFLTEKPLLLRGFDNFVHERPEHTGEEELSLMILNDIPDDLVCLVPPPDALGFERLIWLAEILIDIHT